MKITLCFLICVVQCVGCKSEKGFKQASTATTVEPASRPAVMVPSTLSSTVGSQVVRYIELGEQRLFSPGGPRFDLPQSYYDYIAQHPLESEPLLEQKIREGHGNAVVNAYDFIVHMASEPGLRPWAMSLIEQAMQADGLTVRKVVEPTYLKYHVQASQ